MTADRRVERVPVNRGPVLSALGHTRLKAHRRALKAEGPAGKSAIAGKTAAGQTRSISKMAGQQAITVKPRLAILEGIQERYINSSPE
ncbi:unnamed protein product [Lota lota]